MPATLTFYRSADSETRSEPFGAIVSGPPHGLHDQVQPGGDGTPNRALAGTRVPHVVPYLLEQKAFLQLSETFILPLLPL